VILAIYLDKYKRDMLLHYFSCVIIKIPMVTNTSNMN